MTVKKTRTNIFKIPKGFKEYKGLCSQQRPQALCREADRCQIETYKRNGVMEVQDLCEINWMATYLPDDVIAWRIL